MRRTHVCWVVQDSRVSHGWPLVSGAGGTLMDPASGHNTSITTPICLFLQIAGPSCGCPRDKRPNMLRSTLEPLML